MGAFQSQPTVMAPPPPPDMFDQATTLLNDCHFTMDVLLVAILLCTLWANHMWRSMVFLLTYFVVMPAIGATPRPARLPPCRIGHAPFVPQAHTPPTPVRLVGRWRPCYGGPSSMLACTCRSSHGSIGNINVSLSRGPSLSPVPILAWATGLPRTCAAPGMTCLPVCTR